MGPPPTECNCKADGPPVGIQRQNWLSGSFGHDGFVIKKPLPTSYQVLLCLAQRMTSAHKIGLTKPYLASIETKLPHVLAKVLRYQEWFVN